MTIDEIIAVLQAYKEGKTIEVGCCGEWNELKEPRFDFTGAYGYRIKPEPHYRPFKSAEEVMEAIKEHGDWVRTKSNIYYVLKSFYYMGDYGYFFTNTHGNVSQGSMLADFVFADGTPFGKLEE